MKKMDAMGWVVFVLLVVGALNWGILGLTALMGTGTNVVNLIVGNIANGLIENLVYVLVGLAGLWKLYKVLMSK